MPGLTQLARFCDGGRVIATIGVINGACGRGRCHILHMWTVFTLHLQGHTGLQGQRNAQEGKYHDKNSSHLASLARRPDGVTRFFDISRSCAVMHLSKCRLRSSARNDPQFSGYVVDFRQFLGTDFPVCRRYRVQRFQQLLLSLVAFASRWMYDGLLPGAVNT